MEMQLIEGLRVGREDMEISHLELADDKILLLYY